MHESAKVCSKITNFFAKPHSSTHFENKNCDKLSSPEWIHSQFLLLMKMKQKKTQSSDHPKSSDCGHKNETPIIDSDSKTEVVLTIEPTPKLGTSLKSSLPPLISFTVDPVKEESLLGKTTDYFTKPRENDLSDYFFSSKSTRRKSFTFFLKKQYFPTNKPTVRNSIDSGYLKIKPTKNCIVFLCFIAMEVPLFAQDFKTGKTFIKG